jgi:hypothetical protein
MSMRNALVHAALSADMVKSIMVQLLLGLDLPAS